MTTYTSHDNAIQIDVDYNHLNDQFTVTAKVYADVQHTAEDGFTYWETESVWEHSETCDSKAYDEGRVDELVKTLAEEAEAKYETINDPDIQREETRKQQVRDILAHIAGNATPTCEQHDILRELAQHALELDHWDNTDYAPYVTSASDDALHVLDLADWNADSLLEAIRYGGWDYAHDEYAHITKDGDIEGLTRQQADTLQWEHRLDIIRTFLTKDDTDMRLLANAHKILVEA